MAKKKSRSRSFMSSERKERWKELAVISAGGLVEYFIEIGVDMSNFEFPWTIAAWNAGDAIGGISAAAISAIGVAKKNKTLTLLGSGAVAVAATNIVTKAIRTWIYPQLPPAQQVALNMVNQGRIAPYSNQGKYNRSYTLYPTPYIGTTYPRR